MQALQLHPRRYRPPYLVAVLQRVAHRRSLHVGALCTRSAVGSRSGRDERSGAIAKVSGSKQPFPQRENIKAVTDAARAIGVPGR